MGHAEFNKQVLETVEEADEMVLSFFQVRGKNNLA
jgi:hypothetical protein